eukprot:scaffold15965_cov37-Attheya_sp.AAC.1
MLCCRNERRWRDVIANELYHNILYWECRRTYAVIPVAYVADRKRYDRIHFLLTAFSSGSAVLSYRVLVSQDEISIEYTRF